MVRHFGVFKFKKNISMEEIDECFLSMNKMVGQIPGLLDMEYGPYNGNEGLNEDFTHGFIMTFDSEESRDEYLPHPIHEEVKLLVVPKLEKVIVFDIVV
ncbi:Stress responsive A/B Barrel Domain [Aquiflexum balticum DSM 16537]|uniref:Stress responsive A/B Barrel Domain n=2 Tax=Aquiflexum TaxID=280472 RepID=A0A1W2H7I7_9BACT|nr:Dabb family protein [Aquiflexum balticum]SMD44873.1 Stress responsive A/B Barrel Domain [Aquiflexum balticum DSM 16537]